MDVLIVAIEQGRWGPARLPSALKDAGLSVAALCPAGNAVAATDYLDRRFKLPATRSSRSLAVALASAIDAFFYGLVVIDRAQNLEVA